MPDACLERLHQLPLKAKEYFVERERVANERPTPSERALGNKKDYEGAFAGDDDRSSANSSPALPDAQRAKDAKSLKEGPKDHNIIDWYGPDDGGKGTNQRDRCCRRLRADRVQTIP